MEIELKKDPDHPDNILNIILEIRNFIKLNSIPAKLNFVLQKDVLEQSPVIPTPPTTIPEISATEPETTSLKKTEQPQKRIEEISSYSYFKNLFTDMFSSKKKEYQNTIKNNQENKIIFDNLFSNGQKNKQKNWKN